MKRSCRYTTNQVSIQHTPKKIKEPTSDTKGSAVNSSVLATQGDAGAL